MPSVRSLAIALSLAVATVSVPEAARGTQRTLTFDERVSAQRILDRLEHDHTIGAPQPFDRVVPMDRTVERVRRTLMHTEALGSWWAAPITQDVLQRELERIARDTRLPERLLGIYAALGNDPFLVREAFVRPQLAERLARRFFAADERIPEPKGSFETWWQRRSTGSGRTRPLLQDDGLEIDAGHASGWLDSLPVPADGAGRQLQGEHWDNGILDDVATARTSHVAVWTGSEMIVWGGTEFGQYQQLDTGARYDLAYDTWRPMSSTGAPSARQNPTAVWTGSEMIVWGGEFPYVATGGRYDPGTDSWAPVSTVLAPTARAGHTAIWTGTKMIVWGGYDALGAVGTGGVYDPAVDAWTPVAPAGAPAARFSHTAVWDGSQMIVWGGEDGSGPMGTGGRYQPSTDSWTPVSLLDAPQPRSDHTSVWTAGGMIVWGGMTPAGMTNTGALYTPSLDAWTPITGSGAPAARADHTAVWTGSRMVVWGGSTAAGPTRSGGRYDPAGDTWTAMPTANAPSARDFHTAVWGAGFMIVYGGGSGLNTGGRYNIFSNSWTPTASTPAASGPAVWTGTEMIVLSRPGSSGRYNPLADTWTPVTSLNHPSSAGTAVWTGTEAITWNGASGGRYGPATDTWVPLPATGAPFAGRGLHSAIWTGQEMIVFGGDTGAGGFEISPTNAGGRYNPATNAWSATPLTGAPAPRAAHSAVWTGSAMIVWGGLGTFGEIEPDGSRYDPASNTWAPTSTVGDPSRRIGHAAVWTGSEMVIWGGNDGDNLGDGARYDPAADLWMPITSAGAPAPRAAHSAVWTGNDMIVWGGDENTTWRSGGRYDPAADAWAAMPAQGAPHSSGHAAVWTGDLMIVWSGLQGGGRFVVTTVNQHPVAVILGDPTVECRGSGGQTIQLDGGSSFDPDGTIASYEWIEWAGTPFARVLGTDPTFSMHVSVRDIDAYKPITLRVTDGQGAAGAQTVFPAEEDTTPPQVTCPAPIVVECADPVATHVDVPGVTATDACSPYISFSRYEDPSNVPYASNNFVRGTTTVIYTAQPEFGPSASCEFTVTVQDTIPPALSVRTEPESLWPANHRMVNAFTFVETADACGTSSWVLSDVTSSEPDDAPGPSDGMTVDDIQGADPGTQDREFMLRAERDSQGIGRTYWITYEAVDEAGLRSSASGLVRVPLSRRRPLPGPPAEP